jgi:hypothetical protein
MGKAYSLDEENWELDWDTFLDVLADREEAEDRRDLIGVEYFEGDSIPITTGEVVDIDRILDGINKDAYEKMGECAEDYPDLTDKEKAKFKELIVSFLDKKDRRNIFNIENSRKKTITAEDLEVMR